MLIEELNKRTDILLDNNILSIEVANYIKKISVYFINEEFEDEKVICFITHLAMMMQRIKEGQIEEPMDAEFIKEIENNKFYYKINKYLLKIIELSKIEIPNSELGYLKLHLCNLVNKEV